jgi:hypothetical protein
VGKARRLEEAIGVLTQQLETLQLNYATSSGEVSKLANKVKILDWVAQGAMALSKGRTEEHVSVAGTLVARFISLLAKDRQENPEQFQKDPKALFESGDEPKDSRLATLFYIVKLYVRVVQASESGRFASEIVGTVSEEYDKDPTARPSIIWERPVEQLRSQPSTY